MKSTITMIAAAVAFSACSSVKLPETVVDPVTTRGLDLVKAELVGVELPGGIVVTEPIALTLAECVVENANEAEMAQIIAAPDTATRNNIVSTVFERPETISCAMSALT